MEGWFGTGPPAAAPAVDGGNSRRTLSVRQCTGRCKGGGTEAVLLRFLDGQSA